MVRETENGSAPSDAGPSWPDRLIMGAFLLFLSGLAGAATIILFHDSRTWVILNALTAAALIWGLEYLESKFYTTIARGRNSYLVPVLLISLLTFAIYLPTVNIYFLGDDFGCLHFFHSASLPQLLKMFHTDLAKVVEGESGQEIRPIYALYYMVSYRLWGLDPLGYHLTAILVDILDSLLVFLIANDMAPGNTWRAGFAGLLAAVQPVHSKAVSWITGSPAEGIPTLFYLAAFLCFMRYRATNTARYLGLSIMAFSACLMCKEIAVTLPMMLVSYDLFRKLEGESCIGAGKRVAPRQVRLRFLLTYLPFALLLLGYLEWRRIVFSHFLGEDFWASAWSGPLRERAAVPAAFLQQFAQFGRYLAGHFAFDLRALLLPLPTLALGFALGLYVVWAVSLLRRRPESRRALAVVLYFGVVWYLISDIPLLVAGPEARHLYLPAVGPCIATAFLAMPTCFLFQKNAGYVRLLGAALLISLFGCQLWKDNSQFVQLGKTSARGMTQMAAIIMTLPKHTLVIIQFPDSVFLPFALQRPFTSVDLYSQARIIEFPSMSGYPLPQWWGKTKQTLQAELADAPDASREIDLLAWDEQSQSLRLQKRVLPGRSVQACVTESLGGPVGSIDSVSDQEADELVKALVRLVLQGG